jgi:SAM-dependent methyltransferase
MTVPGIPGRVHVNDFMLRATDPDSARVYVEDAADVLRLVDRALSQVGRHRYEVRRWLDFGCGYGRIVRLLVQDVPPDRVWITDVLPQGVTFCSREFHAEPISNLAQRPDLTGSFEVIYACSVVTHLPEAQVESTADLLAGALAPGGVLVFTTHGEWSLERPERYGREFLGKGGEIEAELARRGCHFIPYAHTETGATG